MPRRAHLVGTYPAANAAQAIKVAFERADGLLDMLSDGETGDRQDWVRDWLSGLRNHPKLAVLIDGDWPDYEHGPVYVPNPGSAMRAEDLELGIFEAFERSYPTFARLRERYGRSELPFQVGIPGPLDLAFYTYNPPRVPRRLWRQRVRAQGDVFAELIGRGPFTLATVSEIRRVHEHAGGDVVFQIEAPGELLLVAEQSPALQPCAAVILGTTIARLARQSPEGARFGVHLCVGDLNHKARVKPPDAGPLVLLALAVARRWPRGRPLEFIHGPIAAGDEPPPTDPDWYEPLRRLDRLRGPRLIAGLADENQDLKTQRLLRDRIERLVGHEVDISTACGLGRRTPEAALRALERITELTR